MRPSCGAEYYHLPTFKILEYLVYLVYLVYWGYLVYLVYRGYLVYLVYLVPAFSKQFTPRESAINRLSPYKKPQRSSGSFSTPHSLYVSVCPNFYQVDCCQNVYSTVNLDDMHVKVDHLL